MNWLAIGTMIGTVRIRISYEDEAGNVTTADKTCTMFVNELMMDDFAMDGRRDPGMEEEESSGGRGAVVRGLIIGAVVLAIAGVGAWTYLRRKKKKEAALHAEDLKDLEELEKDAENDGAGELDSEGPADDKPVE